MYDKDGSGTIELPEMIEIIGTLYEMEGVTRVSITAMLDLVIIDNNTFPSLKLLGSTKLGHHDSFPS